MPFGAWVELTGVGRIDRMHLPSSGERGKGIGSSGLSLPTKTVALSYHRDGVCDHLEIKQHHAAQT